MDKTLGIKINFISLLKFALPTVISNIFTSIYSSIDGIFVSNFIGTQALSTINIIMPIIFTFLAIGTMFGTGGNALISKKLGESKINEAKQNMTLLVLVTLISSSILSTLCIIFKKSILYTLGANPTIYKSCIEYADIIFLILPFVSTEILFQMFFITEGRPNLSMLSSLIGGLTNIILDYILIVKFDLGLKGAAIATGIGYSITTFIGIIFFTINKKGTLKFTIPKFDFKIIWKSCSNGASEITSLLSTSIETIVINNIMIRLAGIDGVSAVTIISYTQYLLTSIYMGYSMGISSLISFNFGKNHLNNLKKIHKISIYTISIISILTVILSLIFTNPIINIFAKPDTSVFTLTIKGFKIFSISLLFMGINIYVSSLFTSLNNGKISATLSFLSTFILPLVLLITLPNIFGTSGIWFSMPMSEILSIIISIFFIKKYKKIYKY